MPPPLLGFAPEGAAALIASQRCLRRLRISILPDVVTAVTEVTEVAEVLEMLEDLHLA